MVMQSWYPATIEPRTFLGAISDMYKIMIAETKPTPIPAMTRPTTRRGTVVEATCRMTPMMKMIQPTMIVTRRPMKSATSPAIRAPKNVPADRIDTMRDCCEEGKWKAYRSRLVI